MKTQSNTLMIPMKASTESLINTNREIFVDSLQNAKSHSMSNFSRIYQYLKLSQHSNKALIEDGRFTQNKTRDSIATNFGKRLEHTLQLRLCEIKAISLAL